MFRRVLSRTWRRPRSQGRRSEDRNGEQVSVSDVQKATSSEVVIEVPVGEATNTNPANVDYDVPRKDQQSKTVTNPSRESVGVGQPPSHPLNEGVEASVHKLSAAASDINSTGHSKSLTELRRVSEEFKGNYESFLKKNSQLKTLDSEIDAAIKAAEGGPDLSYSAVLFQAQMSKVLEIINRKEESGEAKWYNKAGQFLGLIYPVVKITIGVATSVADGTGFLPLKGAGNGIALLLQVCLSGFGAKYRGSWKAIRGGVANRLISNRHFETMSGSAIIKERATCLLIGIMAYLNAALIFFCKDFFTNLMITLGKGPEVYEDGENALKNAIRRYNEAICDFTASCVVEERQQRFVHLKEKHDDMFLQWLSPSHWKTEAQLQLLRRRYQDSSLKWAHRMDEFQNWSSSNVYAECKERILWIVGAPGVGKSTLAGYLVEFTRCLDKDAILAYFFIRKEFNGLTKASDIVRTIAYQCSTMDPRVRASLETLKTNGFQTDDTLGLQLLSTKLLLEPLSQSKKPIYIIIDGVEEADNSMDPIDMRRRAIEILIEQLCNLPSTRLLFFSRPQSIPGKIKQQSIFRSIGYSENKGDIEAYVRYQLKEHESLETRFAKEGIEPVQFFLCNSNGIFLWVVLLLEQLSKATRNVFRKYVRDVTQTPSDMTQLYINILQGLKPDERKWVREILYWIIGPRRPLTVEELQNAVEWYLEDELPYTFQDFLEVQCGSIFLIAGINERGGVVQIVHETLRSFLSDAERCPADLHVTTDSAHDRLAAASLSLLTIDTVEFQPIYCYVAGNWNYHLINVKRSSKDDDILLKLYHFFHSPNLKKWVYHQLVEEWNTRDRLSVEMDIEDKVLRDVRDWLIRFQRSGRTQISPVHELQEAMRWGEMVLNQPNKLGEYVGKASASIWLVEDLKSKENTLAAFELATRHYWRRDGRVEFSNRDELDGLIRTNFDAMLTWAGDSKTKDMHLGNLAVAHSVLKQWDENLEFKRWITGNGESEIWDEICRLHSAPTPQPASVPSTPVNSATRSPRKLAAAHASNGRLSEAVEIWKLVAECDPTDPTAWVELADAYRAINRYDEAVTAYKRALELKPSVVSVYEHLSEVYRVLGRHDKSIETLEIVVQQNNDAETWAGLGRAYRAALNEGKAMECFQRSVEINPAFAPGWKSLVDIYNIKREFHKTVDAYEKESVADPTCSWVWSGLGDAYRGASRGQDAIRAYKTAVQRNPIDSWAWTCLGDAYRTEMQHDDAIHAFWVSIEKNPRDSWPWKGLAESYTAKNETTRAIAVYAKASVRLPIDYSLLISLGILLSESGHSQMATASFDLAIERCPAKQRLLFAFISLPTSHLFSNYPVIAVNDEFGSSLLWHGLGRALLETGETARAMEIYDSAIEQYTSAIHMGPDNRLLWVYSSYLATRGFDPFENKNDLPMEILWTLLGQVYREKGDWGGAIQAFEKAVELLPQNKWLWNALGGLHELDGNHGKSHEAYKMGAEVCGHYCETIYCY